MSKLDEEIHEVEARIERERHALADAAAHAAHSAKCGLTNPKVLLLAAGIGYVLGELIQQPKKLVRAVPAKAESSRAGIAGSIGTFAAALLRAGGYGSPLALAQSVLQLLRSAKSGREESIARRRAAQATALYR